MVIFLLAILSLLSVVNVCRLQSHLGNALNRTALFLSQYSYFYYASGMYSASSDVKEAVNDAESAISDPNAAAELIGNTVRLFGGEDGAEEPSELFRTLFLGGIAGGMKKVESDRIVAPIVRTFFLKELGADAKDTDAYLVNRGVSNGVDGLDFSMSSLFPAENPEEIGLVLCYDVKLPFFRGLDVTVMQNALTGAWLGGDRTKDKIARSDGESGQADSDTDGESVWAMDPFDRGKYLTAKFKEEHGFQEARALPTGIDGYDQAANTFVGCTSINTFSPGYNDRGFSASAASRNAIALIKKAIDSAERTENVTPASVSMEFTVIIPEDAPPDIANRLTSYLVEKTRQINKENPHYRISCIIVRKGGNAKPDEQDNTE